MSLGKSFGRRLGAALLTVSLGVVHPAALLAADQPPEQSTDGLQLRKSTSSTLIYVRPGANFGKYDKVAILDCFVEFDKNWQRDYNSDQMDPSARVGTDDMNRIKTRLAQEFKKVFTRELTKGGYQVVDFAAPDVLVLRPALTKLRVTAPDIMTPGIGATVVRSAGSATLYLELWDSATNTILARVFDAKADQGMGGRLASSVSNLAAADFVLQDWADALRKRLEAARANTN